MEMNWAVEALSQYGLMGMFWVVALEYACFPLPSEVLLPLAGLGAAAAGIPPALSVFVSVAAGLTGSMVCYLLGRFGETLLSRLLSHFPKAEEKLAQTRAWSASFGGLSVMVARVIPLCRTWISFAAGLTAQRVPSFLLYSSMGIIVWNTLLLGSGYLLYSTGTRLAPHAVWMLPVCTLTLLSASAAIRRLLKRRRLRTDP